MCQFSGGLILNNANKVSKSEEKNELTEALQYFN